MKTIAFLILFPSLLMAAIPEKKTTPPQNILQSLRSHHNVAVEKIYKLGPKGYKDLYAVSFSNNYPMAVRWKAFMVMTSIGGKKSQPEIEKALTDKKWFMRSAGLLAMEKVNPKKSQEWAKKLFVKDPALMVRAKAIEVLESGDFRKVKAIMWKQLYAKKNFHRNKGLWIRHRIMEYISENSTKSDLPRFSRVLADPDKKLHAMAVKGIERVIGQPVDKKLSPAAKVAYWKAQLRNMAL